MAGRILKFKYFEMQLLYRVNMANKKTNPPARD